MAARSRANRIACSCKPFRLSQVSIIRKQLPRYDASDLVGFFVVPIGFWPTSLPHAVYANRSADASGRQVRLLSKVSPASALGWPSRLLAQLYILTASSAFL